jgi:hypothetical protein
MPVGGGTTRAGLEGQYFANPEFKGKPAFTRRDVRINFDWKEGVAGRGLPVGGATTPGMAEFPHDDFSISWTGAVVPRFSEAYTFRITGKDGVRFKLGGRRLVDSLDKSGVHEVTAPMKKGEKVDLVLEYVDRAGTGASEVKLEWSSPSTPREVIEPLSFAQTGDHLTGGLHNEYADMKWCVPDWGSMQGNAKLTEEELDENGWPAVADFRIPFRRVYPGRHLVRFKGKAQLTAHLCNGTWFLSADGSGEGRERRLAKGLGYSEEDGTTTVWFDLAEGSRNFGFNFQDSERPDGTPGLLELEVYGPVKRGSMTYNPPGQVRIAEGLEVVKNFVVERLHIGSSLNPGTKWEERTLPSYHAIGKGMIWDGSKPGLNLEKYIMKVNESGNDWHICCGASWDQEYMRKFARLVRYGSDGVEPYDHYVENPKYPPLNPNLRIYLEHSNELPWAVYPRRIWDDLRKKVEEDHPDWRIVNYDGKCNGADSRAMHRYHALRMKQISDAFREVCKDVPDAIGDRARVLCFGQYASDRMNVMLQFLDSYFNKTDPKSTYEGEPHPPSYYIWGGGGAIYYGCGNRFGLMEKEPIADGGFEDFGIADGQAMLRPENAGWTFTGSAGVCDVRLARRPAIAGEKLPGRPAKPLPKDQWVGCKFTVGEKDLYVYQLGRMVIKGNRLGHAVAVFAEDGQMLVETHVSVHGTEPGSYAYAWCGGKAWGNPKVFPLLLEAGKTYYLASREQRGRAADRFFGADTDVSAADGLSIEAAVMGADGKTWQETPGSRCFGPVNMIFTDQVLTTADGLVGVPPDNSSIDLGGRRGRGFSFGKRCAFLQGESTMSREFTVAEAGAYWITFNCALDRITNGYTQYNWGGWGTKWGGGTIRIRIDGEDVTPTLLPQGGYNAVYHVFHYMASKTFRLEPGKHTVTFERVEPKGGTAFIDEVHLSSEMAFYGGPEAPNFPAGGHAIGQHESDQGAYYRNARAECEMSRNWGLVPMTYEGGWAVQADFDHYSYLAWDDLRFGSEATNPELTKQALRNAFDMWCDAGGYIYAYFYPFQRDLAQMDAPLLRCIQEFNDRLGREPSLGNRIPAALTSDLDHYQNNPNNDYYGFNASRKKAGPLMLATTWKSWIVIARETADYQILVDATEGGTFQLDVDGFKLADGKTGDKSVKPALVRLTRGQHAIRVRNTGGLFFLKAVHVARTGEEIALSDGAGKRISFPEKPADAVIDIRKACNRSIEDNAEPGREGGGWAGFGRDSCFRGLKPGRTDFGYKLVAFEIIDAGKNNGKACIVLSGPQRAETFPKVSEPIAVGRKAAALYFLHTSMFVNARQGEPIVRYRIRYGDGTEEVFACRNRVDLGDWWGLPNLPNGLAVYNENNRVLMVTPWKNPHPEKTIETITMESTGRAIPILLAITASKDLDEYQVFRKVVQ